MTESQTFVSWKPVAYTNSNHSRQTQSLLHDFSSSSGKLSSYECAKWSIATGIKNVKFYPLNITFGMTKDGWYKETNYSSWYDFFKTLYIVY